MSLALQLPIRAISRGNRILTDVALDVIFYAVDLNVADFDYVLESYRKHAPRTAWRWFKIHENAIWDRVEQPIQPASTSYGRGPLAFLDSVRARIREGRPVELRIWDREEERSWNFSCFRYFPEEGGCYSFYRVLAPRDTDPKTIEALLADWAQRVRGYSAHAGYCFTYNFMERHLSFSEIYRYARRFWGVDVEYLNATLPMMDRFIKGVQWLTFLGEPLLEAREDANPDLGKLSKSFSYRKFPAGHLFRITDLPVWGDRNKLTAELTPYLDAARVLAPLFPEDVPNQFPGTFAENEATLDWFRRFLKPSKW